MNRTSVFVCAILSLGVAAWAGTKSYTIAVYKPVLAGATELQPGDYQLKVEGDKATLHKGKISAENPVKVETVTETYPSTSVVLTNGDGKLHIKEIHLAGTKTKVVFTETQP
jgi:dethiobiotin synthetase